MRTGWFASIVTAAALVAAVDPPVHAQGPATPAVLLDVPYLPQSEALCGGAAAAMVMRFWGAAGVYAETFGDLVRADEGGIRGEDLGRAIETRGWHARSLSADPAFVRMQIERRRPLVALVDDRPGRLHYVVVVGWSGGRVVVHDPARAPFRVWSEEEFIRRWAASRFWTMLILPGSDDAAASFRLKAEAARSRSRVVASAFSRKPAALCDPIVDEGVRLSGRGEREEARRLFELAAAACPASSAPRREIAGLHALAGEWRNAATHASSAVELDPDDAHAWRILATARFLEGDREEALEAWNRVGRPRVDLVNVRGLERTRFGIVGDAVGIAPGDVLTSAALGRARRRVTQLPAIAASRVMYEPRETGLANVEVTLFERSKLPTSRPALAAAAVRMAGDREAAVAVASPTGGGELWTASWRWWEHRPRLAFGFAAPGPFGGVLRLDALDERQTYGDAGAALVERQRSVAVGWQDWASAVTRWDVRVGADRWLDRGASLSVGAGVERRAARDRAVVSARAATWIGDVRAWTASARAAWRSTSEFDGTAWHAGAGIALADRDAPLALWSGAGTTQRADALLRAHPAVVSGRVDDAVLGRRLTHAGVEWRQWLPPLKHVVRIAPAVFVDAAHAARGAAFTDPRAHVDAGLGLRVALPGVGVVGIDVARGLRDGRTAVSFGWRP